MDFVIPFFWTCTILYTLFGAWGICKMIKEGYSHNLINKSTSFPWQIIACILTISICNVIGGDFWGYMLAFQKGTFTTNEDAEWVWPILVSCFPDNYFLFRAFVWGLGILCFCTVSKLTDARLEMSCYLFLIFYIFTFSYARVAIAYNFVYFSLAICLYYYKSDTKKRYLFYLVAIGLIVFALGMHASMAPFVFIVIISQILPFNKKYCVIYLLIFPFLWQAMDKVIFPALLNSGLLNETLFDKSQSYMYSDYASNEKITYVTQYIPILCLFFCALIVLFNSVEKNEFIIKLSSVAFFTIYVSFLFLSVESVNTNLFFYRYMDMSYPAMIISISYCYSHNKLKPIVLIALACIKYYNIWFMLAATIIHPDRIVQHMFDRL